MQPVSELHYIQSTTLPARHLVERLIPNRSAVDLDAVPARVLASLLNLLTFGLQHSIVLFWRHKVHFVDEHAHKGTLLLLLLLIVAILEIAGGERCRGLRDAGRDGSA